MLFYFLSAVDKKRMQQYEPCEQRVLQNACSPKIDFRIVALKSDACPLARDPIVQFIVRIQFPSDLHQIALVFRVTRIVHGTFHLETDPFISVDLQKDN